MSVDLRLRRIRALLVAVRLYADPDLRSGAFAVAELVLPDLDHGQLLMVLSPLSSRFGLAALSAATSQQVNAVADGLLSQLGQIIDNYDDAHAPEDSE